METNVLLERQNGDLILLRGLLFQASGSFTSLKSHTRDPRLEVPPRGLVLRICMSWKNPSTSAGFEPENLGSWDEHVTPRLPRPTKHTVKMAPSLLCIERYIQPLLIEKDLCDCQKSSIIFCVLFYMYLSSRDPSFLWEFKFKRNIRTWTRIWTSDLQICSLALYHLNYPGSSDGTGLNLSHESNVMQGVFFWDTVMNWQWQCNVLYQIDKWEHTWFMPCEKTISDFWNILTGKATKKIPLGRPRRRWEENIRVDI